MFFGVAALTAVLTAASTAVSTAAFAAALTATSTAAFAADFAACITAVDRSAYAGSFAYDFNSGFTADFASALNVAVTVGAVRMAYTGTAFGAVFTSAELIGFFNGSVIRALFIRIRRLKITRYGIGSTRRRNGSFFSIIVGTVKHFYVPLY